MRPNRPHRGRTEIMFDLCRVVAEGEHRKTRTQMLVGTDTHGVEKYVTLLVERGILEEKINGNRERYLFLTLKGGAWYAMQRDANEVLGALP